jgi:hypothetical protein
MSSLDASKQFKIGNYVDIDNTVSRSTHHELIDLRELYHIWKPIIEQVGKVSTKRNFTSKIFVNKVFDSY